MVCRASVLFCALSLLLLAPVQAQPHTADTAAAYGDLPMSFEENHGQTDSRVKFVARGAGYAFFITNTESVAVLQKEGAAPAIIRMQLTGASPHPRVEGDQLFEGKSNYLIGSDPSKWRTGVPQFGKVRMSEVYEGIDVVWYGNQKEIEYDFVVAPGSDPRQIRMHFKGAERIDIDAAGDLVLQIAGGELRQRAPFVYQQRGGSRQAVQARYRRLGANEFGFALGAYDPEVPLIIDPVLAWSTYLGGSGDDTGNAIDVDATGNAYVTGRTESLNFPTANAFQATRAGLFDAFVTKFNAAGTALVYSTYLGGSSFDLGFGIAVDGSGNAYVTGITESNNFPTVNAIQTTYRGLTDTFVTKLNAAGTALLYSTYLGGTGIDNPGDIAVDGLGNAYVAGITNSTDFPTANALQASNAGSDAFVTKLNPAGTALVWSTYLGGSGHDQARDVTVDGVANVYVTGETTSPNFPVANALQASNAGGSDAFVTKINAAGTALIYSTYLGGTGADHGAGIALDGTGNVHVSGYTTSTNFPTANAVQASNAGLFDGFVATLNAAGAALVYSTYLGGSGDDNAFDIAADTAGHAYVTGRTNSPNFPTVNAFQPVSAGLPDAYVTIFNPAGSMVESTYLGGSGHDDGMGIAIDAIGGIYATGVTLSTNFPTLNPVQGSFGGVQDAFVTKLLATSADVGIAKVATGAFFAGQDSTFTITVTNSGPGAATGVTVTDILPAEATFVSATPSQGSCSGTSTVTCTLGTIDNAASATIALVVRPAAAKPLSNTASVTTTSPDPNPANDSSTAIAAVAAGNANLSITKLAGTFFVSQNGTFSITVRNNGPTAAGAVTVTDVLPPGVTFVSASSTRGSCSGTATVICSLGTLANGATATITLVVRPTAAGQLTNMATVTSPAIDSNPGNNVSVVTVQVQPAPAAAAIPALDARTLMLLAALLATFGMWIAGRRS